MLGLLLAGGYYAYRAFLSEGEGLAESLSLMGEKGKENGSGTSALIGSWYGTGESSTDEGYLRFNADGTLNLADPAEGWWTTVEYRIQEEGGISYLEFFNNDFETWERYISLELAGKDTLLLKDGETTVELKRISDRQFEEVISSLAYEDIY